MEELVAAFSGASAGAIATFVLYPLDTALVRYQSSRRPAEREPGFPHPSSSVVGMARLEEEDNESLYRRGGASGWQRRGAATDSGTRKTGTQAESYGARLDQQEGYHPVTLSGQKETSERRMVGSLQPFTDVVAELFGDIHRKGWLKLYNGVGFKVTESLIRNFVYFYVYQSLKRRYEKHVGRIGSSANLFLATAAAVLNQCITAPFEVVSTNLQTSGMTLQAVVTSIYQAEGLSGFYRGFVSSLILCSNPAITNAAFDQLKLNIQTLLRSESVKTLQGKPPELTAFQSFILGAVSKAAATMLTYPHIRSKVLVQAQATRRLRRSVHHSAHPQQERRFVGDPVQSKDAQLFSSAHPLTASSPRLSSHLSSRTVTTALDALYAIPKNLVSAIGSLTPSNGWKPQTASSGDPQRPPDSQPSATPQHPRALHYIPLGSASYILPDEGGYVSDVGSSATISRESAERHRTMRTGQRRNSGGSERRRKTGRQSLVENRVDGESLVLLDNETSRDWQGRNPFRVSVGGEEVADVKHQTRRTAEKEETSSRRLERPTALTSSVSVPSSLAFFGRLANLPDMMAQADMLRAASFCMSEMGEPMMGLDFEDFSMFQLPRSQSEASLSEPERGVVDILVSTIMQDGVLGLYRGLGLQLFKTVMAAAILYMVKEKMEAASAKVIRFALAGMRMLVIQSLQHRQRRMMKAFSS